MKKLHRAVLAALFAVMLALGALGFAACSDADNNTPKAQYTMTFMVGTMVYDTVTATEGSPYQTKDDPVRINSVFDGWSLTENGEVEALPEKMPSEDRTYYAVFSAQFTLVLNADIGNLDCDDKMQVKVGEDLYAKLSSITPTLDDGNAVFDGWYLRGTEKIVEGAGITMPNGNTEVVAKYSVAYTVNVYKELEFNKGTYSDTPAAEVTGTALVGEKVTGLPAYTGFRYDNDKNNTALNDVLGKNSAQNVLSVYYEYIVYDAEFNANLPEDEYEGNTATIPCGYRLGNEAPDCGYTADGYRFQGWATTYDGDVEYYPGDEFAIERATIFYAKWVKGLTELTGLSSDRVYIMGKVEDPTVTVAYLERVGLNDILGTYNKATHVFEFNGVENGPTLLRGVADTTRNTFTYLNTENNNYALLGSADATKNTITLNADNTAVYVDEEGDTANGSYMGDEDGSLKFVVDGQTQFAFRLVMSDDGIASYEIRGEEYGEWRSLGSDGYVDVYNKIFLDGYGYAVISKAAVDTSAGALGWVPFGGVYQSTKEQEDAYDGNDGKEFLITFVNNSLNTRPYLFLFMEGDYKANGSTQSYTNVYQQYFAATLYGAPAEGDTVDTATADKLELSGYGALNDSATYTYKNTEGETVTVEGKYAYDSLYGIITLTAAGGAEYVFEVGTVGEGDNAVTVFELESKEKECGKVNVRGDNGVIANVNAYVYNDGVIAIAFDLLLTDTFFGTYNFDYMMSIIGEYELILAGTEDKTGNVYEFVAMSSMSSTLATAIQNFCRLNPANFMRFKFQLIYSATDPDKITDISILSSCDQVVDEVIEYNGGSYKLDGYGKAVNTEDDKNTISYDTGTLYGFRALGLNTPTADNPKAQTLFINVDGKEYVEVEKTIRVANAEAAIYMAFIKNDTAILLFSSSQSVTPFAYGTVEWNTDHTSGTYDSIEGYSATGLYSALSETYAQFGFSVITRTDTNDKGETVTQTFVFIDFEVEVTPNADGKYVITNADGDKLTLDSASTTAKYVKKGAAGQEATEYEGTYSYANGTISLNYTQNNTLLTITFKLVYGTDVSFEVIGNEVGYALCYNDVSSYMELTGTSTGTDGVYNATYYKYDADGKFTAYQGTYRKSQFGVEGFDFTYNDGNSMFTFITYTSAVGLKIFRIYTPTVQFNVYTMSLNNLGQPSLIAKVEGGGYNDYVLRTQGGNTACTFEKYNDESDVYVLTANGSTFYFERIDTNTLFLLDNTYFLETNGTFVLSTPFEVTVPGTPGSIDTPAVPEHKATITKVKLTGYAIAEMSYTYSNGEEKTVQAIYVQTASSTYALLDANGNLLARIRLMVRTETNGSKTYFAEVCDTQCYGVFKNDSLEVVSLNGFNSAVYVDSYGRVYSGTYTKDDNGVVCVTYIDTYHYTVGRVYMTLDLKTGKFTVVPAPESSVPESGN